MKKSCLLLVAAMAIGSSVYAGPGDIGSVVSQAPAPVTMKCTLSDMKGSVHETLVFEYGSGQKLLGISGSEKIIVEVSDNNALEAGLHDVKIYLKDSIVSAKSVTVSNDQTHGAHVVLASKKITSIFCGI